MYVPGAIISEEFEFEIEACCSGILQRNLTTKREIALSCTQLLCSEPTSISRHITQPTFSFRTCSFLSHCPRPLATWQRAAKLSRIWKLKLTKPGSSPHTTSIVLSAPAKRGDPTRQAAWQGLCSRLGSKPLRGPHLRRPGLGHRGTAHPT